MTLKLFPSHILRSGFDSRFGWFIPENAADNSPPIKDHWRAFTSTTVSKMFSPSDEDYKIIKANIVPPGKRLTLQNHSRVVAYFNPE